jgi:hypothetical protein
MQLVGWNIKCVTGKLFLDDYGQMPLIKQETPRSGKTALALGERSRTETYDLARKDLKSLLEKIYQDRGFDFREYKEKGKGCTVCFTLPAM